MVNDPNVTCTGPGPQDHQSIIFEDHGKFHTSLCAKGVNSKVIKS